MSKKKIVGIVVLIIGIGCFIFGSYIASKVADGEKKLAFAEKGLDQGDRIARGPLRRNATEKASEAAHKKLDEKKEEAAKYEMTADWLRGIGIVLFVIGAGSFVMGCRFRKNH